MRDMCNGGRVHLRRQETTLPALPAVDEVLSEESLERRQRHARGIAYRFLKGPVPMSWLERAANLPGKALHVAVAIRFQAGLTGQKSFRLPPALLRRFGVSRQAAY